jgi:hypothetical protein
VPDTIQTLKHVVETLAPLHRRAGSEAEREAAEWIADRLERAAAPAGIDEELFYDGYAAQMLPLGAAGAVAGALATLGKRRILSFTLGALAAAAIGDDASNGARVWRKRIQAPKTTWNVVAEIGDPSCERTLVVLAHHDAAPTGRVFDPSFQRWLARRFPDLVERSNTSFPLWWPIAGAPALAALAALAGRRKLAAVATTLSTLNVALGIELSRSEVVPGANDNLSAVAAEVAVAERLRDAPVDGVRVLLASCGAEEVLQGGIYGFVEHRLSHLPRDRTWVLNLDTVGSIGSPSSLVMLEGEGTFKMEDYTDPSFRDLVATAAERSGVALHRGARARSSTDSVIPSRAGFPTATIISWEPDTKLLSNYHLMSDTPENLDYETVAEAVTLTYAVAEELARI